MASPSPLVIAQSRAPALLTEYQKLDESVLVEVLESAQAAIESARAKPIEALLLHLDEEAEAALAQLPPEIARRAAVLVDGFTGRAALLASVAASSSALLVKSNGLLAEELAIAVRKLRADDPFGLGFYLAPGTTVAQSELTDSSRRGEAIDLLDRFFSDADIEPRFVGQLLTIADELISNAFYNAPVDHSGRPLFAHLSRLDPVLSTDHPIELTYGFDGRFAALAVRDRFGSLSPETLVNHLQRSLVAAGPNEAASGAGLGLGTAYRAASKLVFNLRPGRATECIGLLEANGGYRKFLEQGRSFHMYHRRDA